MISLEDFAANNDYRYTPDDIEKAYSRYTKFIDGSTITLEEFLAETNVPNEVTLEDIHVVDKDEEHELATIVELFPGMITDNGREAWSDVLDAKVERISEGFYGTEIEVSGAAAKRVSAFSFALAGYCPAIDYHTWFNDSKEA